MKKIQIWKLRRDKWKESRGAWMEWRLSTETFEGWSVKSNERTKKSPAKHIKVSLPPFLGGDHRVLATLKQNEQRKSKTFFPKPLEGPDNSLNTSASPSVL